MLRKIKNTVSFIILIIILTNSCSQQPMHNKGAYFTGSYKNLFKDLLGKSEQEINAKIDKAYNQLFFGNSASERIYYETSGDMSYIFDVASNDVRTEGISYGLMIAIQLDRKSEFDRIWKWAKTYMQHKEGQYKDYFAWHCNVNGEIIDSNSASDGEEWIVTSLFFASARWGDGTGIFNYSNEAQMILDAMLSKVENSDDPSVVTNMFNKDRKQVVFVPTGNADDFTDPSYHLPHFYELWSRWSKSNNEFWSAAADTSREYFKRTAHPLTGLMPDYSKFDGTPYSPWGGGHENFQYDAWRVAMNIGLDYEWFRKDNWHVEQSNRYLKFFYDKGVKTHGHLFTLDGEEYLEDHSTGLIAMNAVACLASDLDIRKEFVEELWNCSVPTGQYRYYDGLLYMMGLLQVSGQFMIYDYGNK